MTSNPQIFIAATNDGGDPDYFYDFYVPFTAMDLISTSPLRAIATSVMSPRPPIGDPKSDNFSLSGTDYMADWVTYITKQPLFTTDTLKSTGTGIDPLCTDPPTVNGSITPSATSVTDTCTKSLYSSITTASIMFYNDSAFIGSTTVSSG